MAEQSTKADGKRGRRKSVLGPTVTTSMVCGVTLYNWLGKQAKRESVVPSVIVNRALARERDALRVAS